MLQTHIFFDSSKDINDYIDLSGGATEFADTNNMYVIKGNGSVIPFKQISSAGFFRNNTNNSIEPGDTIVVPIQINTGYGIRTSC